MKLERFLRLPVAAEEALEAASGFFLNEGYRARPDSQALAFRRGSVMVGLVTFSIEQCPTALDVTVSPSGGGASQVLLAYRISCPFKFPTSLDQIFIDLEADAFAHYVATGERRSAKAEIAPMRGPVRAAIAVNAIVSTLLVGAVGVMAGVHLLANFIVAVLISIVNTVSIAAFADLIIEGARKLPRRP